MEIEKKTHLVTKNVVRIIFLKLSYEFFYGF